MKLTDTHWFWLVFAILMGLLGIQAAMYPTLEGDALEIVAAVKTHGVIHSPGFPVYMILIHLFSTLLFFIKISHAISLFSVFCAALSSSVLYWLARQRGVDKGGALVFSVLPVFSLEVWYQSLIQEVYSLAVLWMLLICQSFMLMDQRNSRWTQGWVLFLLVSGFGVHLYVWPLIPIGLGLLLWKWKKQQWTLSPRGAGLAVVLGLLPFLYLPLMAGNSRYINEGNINSFERFVDHVTWKLHRERLANYEDQRQNDQRQWFSVKAKQLLYFISEVGAQYWLPLLGMLVLLIFLILVPWPVSFLKRGPPTSTHHLLFAFSLGLFLNIWLIFSGGDYQTSVLSEMKVHLVPMYYFFSLWLAMGFQLFQNPQFRRGVLVVTSLLLLGHVIWFFKALNIRNNDIAVRHGHELLQNLPQDSILLSQGDVDLMAIIYQQAVEGFRTDIQLVNLVNGTRWYFENLQNTVSRVEWPLLYSKYFQLEVIEKNFGKMPIYFSNYYAALLVLQHSTIKGRFLVIPEKGGYKLTVEKQMIKDSVDSTVVKFTNFVPIKTRGFFLRGVEKDISGQYMDYYSRRAELLSVFNKKNLAEQEWKLGSRHPVFDSRFNQLIRNQLLKVQQRFNIRDSLF